jgi:radical SAM protein with 4Fe4S-binding SPASM domain
MSEAPQISMAPRARRVEDGSAAKPLYAVWELTMKCDQPCQHCGSRAGRSRPEELSTEEILNVARGLVNLGCREVALIGGEAYLREDIFTIVRFLADQGLRVNMQTGGRAMTRERAESLRDAGLWAIGVSVDGLAEVHDVLRGNRGSYAAAMRALEAGAAAGLVITANTQVNRLSRHHLPELAEELRKRGAAAWQVQITVPMGRAADRPDWILEPWEIVPVIDTLAAIQKKALAEHKGTGPVFDVIAANNLGYYGPHEMLLRSHPSGVESHWGGCRAGINTIGIESDGTVKACPSLPTAPYVGGNVRNSALAEIWTDGEAMRFSREWSADELWGFCKTCYYAENCHGGCSWTAHCTLGRRGNNPFCYHRVKTLEKRGIRERLVQREKAPNEPYDFGRFELVEEPFDAAAEGLAGTNGGSRVRLPVVG